MSSQEGRKELREFLSSGPCFLWEVQVQLFSENDEGGAGRGSRKAPKVWSGRGSRAGLQGSDRAQWKRQGQEFDTVPNPMAVRDSEPCVRGSRG